MEKNNFKQYHQHIESWCKALNEVAELNTSISNNNNQLIDLMKKKRSLLIKIDSIR